MTPSGPYAALNEDDADAVAPAAAAATFTVGASLPPPTAAVPHASTSAMRLHESTVPVITIRILVVVTGANDRRRHTRVFPVTVVPGIVCQADPFQYCASKSRSPYCVNVVAAVGSTGAQNASWTVNTSTSPIVLVPLKSTCSQSG